MGRDAVVALSKKGKYGPEDMRPQDGATKALIVPTTCTVYASDNTTVATVYSNRTGSSLTNPLPTGVTVGQPGIDVVGNVMFWATPGEYYLGINGVREPVTILPDVVELVALVNTILTDPAAGTAGMRTLGTGATQALPGNTTLTATTGSDVPVFRFYVSGAWQALGTPAGPVIWMSTDSTATAPAAMRNDQDLLFIPAS